MTPSRRKHYLTWALLLSTLLCLAGSASAAGKNEPTTQPRAFGRLDEALSTLNLTDDQKQQVDQIKQEAAENARENFKGLKNLPPDQRREKLQEVFSGIRDQLASVLTPDQMQQLKQKLQSEGGQGAGRGERTGRQFNLDQAPSTQPSGGLSPKAAAKANERGPMLQRFQEALDKLNLTADQKTKVDSALDDLAAKVKKLRQDDKGNGDARTQVRQAMEQFRNQLQTILTPDQLQQLRQNMPHRDGQDPPGNNKQPTNTNTPDTTGAKASAASSSSSAASTTQPAVQNALVGTMAPPAPFSVGQPAPDFSLHRLSGSVVTLKSFVDKPLVLIFGSYTSPSFRDRVSQIEALQAKYRFSANFLVVYTREAHAQNEWDVQRNMDDGVKVDQPKTIEERTQLAARAKAALKLTTDVAVDDMDDSVAKAYQAGQNGAAVISRYGKVVGTQKWCDPSGLAILLDTAMHQNN